MTAEYGVKGAGQPRPLLLCRRQASDWSPATHARQLRRIIHSAGSRPPRASATTFLPPLPPILRPSSYSPRHPFCFLFRSAHGCSWARQGRPQSRRAAGLLLCRGRWLAAAADGMDAVRLRRLGCLRRRKQLQPQVHLPAPP